MSCQDEIAIGINTDKLDQDIEKVETKLIETSRKITNISRKGFNTVVILGQITGMAIDQSFQLMFQAAMIAAETVTAIAAAQSITVVGAVNAALSLTAAGLLFAQASLIRQQRSESSVQIQGLISLANEWRF